MNIRKPTQKFLVDVASLVLFTLMIATGLLIRYTLPPGRGQGSAVLGLTRHDWGDIHFWISLALMILLVVHLVLHWPWIAALVKGKRPERARIRVAVGLAGVLALLVLILSTLVAPVERPPYQPNEAAVPNGAAADLPKTAEQETSSSRGEAANPPVVFSRDKLRGSMTLAEISRVTGVPTAFILESLQIDPGTADDEQIGRLKNAYGFSMADVRGACASYKQ